MHILQSTSYSPILYLKWTDRQVIELLEYNKQYCLYLCASFTLLILLRYMHIVLCQLFYSICWIHSVVQTLIYINLCISFIFQYLSFVQQLLTIPSHSLFFVTNTLLYKFYLLISSLHTLINIIFYASPYKIWQQCILQHCASGYYQFACN